MGCIEEQLTLWFSRHPKQRISGKLRKALAELIRGSHSTARIAPTIKLLSMPRKVEYSLNTSPPTT
jgi:hypothetical protein